MTGTAGPHPRRPMPKLSLEALSNRVDRSDLQIGPPLVAFGEDLALYVHRGVTVVVHIDGERGPPHGAPVTSPITSATKASAAVPSIVAPLSSLTSPRSASGALPTPQRSIDCAHRRGPDEDGSKPGARAVAEVSRLVNTDDHSAPTV